MAKTRKQKEKSIEALEESFKKAKSIIFFDFTHLTVNAMQDLRKRLQKDNAALQVVKKTLFHLALAKNKDLASLEEEVKISGPLALTFGRGDESAAPKTLAKFQKENKDFVILGGILGGKFLPPERVLALAKLPSLEAMRGQTVGAIAAPLSGFANALAGNIRNIIYILKNISEKSAA